MNRLNSKRLIAPRRLAGSGNAPTTPGILAYPHFERLQPSCSEVGFVFQDSDFRIQDAGCRMHSVLYPASFIRDGCNRPCLKSIYLQTCIHASRNADGCPRAYFLCWKFSFIWPCEVIHPKSVQIRGESLQAGV